MSEDHTPAADEAQPAAETGELEALRAEAAALKEQVLRYAADAENTKRRAEREANDARAYAIQKFARDLLGVADNLQRALAAAPEAVDGPVKNFVVGVEMTDKELQAAFDRNGLKRVEPAPGAKFDPHQHQAVMEQPSAEIAGGGVIQVLQSGYELFGRVVRPAMVIVAAKGSGPQTSAEPQAHNPYDSGETDASGGAVDRTA
ncbi:MAG: nucleotide exchange factor GrpE [Phenylobacterium sp.]|uniref:nucleotide exchange factor GrpE n=1 Tax=Phenylobacterium sp. TaxID=1871053 RepID=UPI002734795D|nr:nucleotide exchange factor GrpE [Phenylobacterium sp.]MDP3173159.1 nucleotide exchange factor GrpE [Phenylobacterium sp.]